MDDIATTGSESALDEVSPLFAIRMLVVMTTSTYDEDKELVAVVSGSWSPRGFPSEVPPVDEVVTILLVGEEVLDAPLLSTVGAGVADVVVAFTAKDTDEELITLLKIPSIPFTAGIAPGGSNTPYDVTNSVLVLK